MSDLFLSLFILFQVVTNSVFVLVDAPGCDRDHDLLLDVADAVLVLVLARLEPVGTLETKLGYIGYNIT